MTTGLVFDTLGMALWTRPKDGHTDRPGWCTTPMPAATSIAFTAE